MARFLFVVPPLTGHVNPTVSVAQSLQERGHVVAWVGHPGKVAPLLPENATLFALDDRVPDELVAEVRSRADSVRGLSGLKFLWEEFLLPLADAMVSGVTDAVERFQPDALIVDQQALAGAIVARQRGIPWASSVTTSAGILDPLAGLPRVRDWLDGALEALQKRHGLTPMEKPDLSPDCVLIFSTNALVGSEHAFPPSYRFVGPSIRSRRDDSDFPWSELRDVPRILISLGTVNADRGARFYGVVCEAFAGEPVQIILVAPNEQVPNPPTNVLVCSWVPQLELLPHVNAVVCHGGHNTVCETLYSGVPLVVAPIKDDQPVVAQQVADAGAGLRLRFGRVRAPKLREAVYRVLQESSFQEAVTRIQSSFRAAGGAEAAAEALEELL